MAATQMCYVYSSRKLMAKVRLEEEHIKQFGKHYANFEQAALTSIENATEFLVAA